jgi:hypothetical protein
VQTEGYNINGVRQACRERERNTVLLESGRERERERDALLMESGRRAERERGNINGVGQREGYNINGVSLLKATE